MNQIGGWGGGDSYEATFTWTLKLRNWVSAVSEQVTQ